MKKLVAAAIIALVGAVSAAPVDAEPRGRGRSRGWRGRHRGRGYYGQRWDNPNPLGSIFGGIIGGWLGSKMGREPERRDERLDDEDGARD